MYRACPIRRREPNVARTIFRSACSSRNRPSQDFSCRILALYGVGGMGRWARLEDQPEHSAGVRPTEGNIPAHPSHRPERTATEAIL
jgi:hypothetical protein